MNDITSSNSKIGGFPWCDPNAPTIRIGFEPGPYLDIDLKDGVLKVSGAMPMDEAAKLFFQELQNIANSATESDIGAGDGL